MKRLSILFLLLSPALLKAGVLDTIDHWNFSVDGKELFRGNASEKGPITVKLKLVNGQQFNFYYGHCSRYAQVNKKLEVRDPSNTLLFTVELKNVDGFDPVVFNSSDLVGKLKDKGFTSGKIRFSYFESFGDEEELKGKRRGRDPSGVLLEFYLETQV